MERLLEVKNIDGGYGKRQILNNINIDLYKGERVLLIGPNGAGKSTLLKVIVGLIRPYKGQIIFKNKEITKLPVFKRIHSGLSYLPQTRNVFSQLTVQENFELACFYCKEQYLKDQLEWIFSIFPFLKDRLQTRAGLLSGGQRQALGVSMALIRQFDVLIVDEPTAGLSPKAAIDILDGIQKAYEDKRFTILMVEHNLRYVATWFDRAVVMRQGSIHHIEDNVERLMDRDVLSRFFFE